MLYADYNATTPLDPEVRAAMADALGASFGNPSSLHQAGQEARRLVERARAEVAALVGADSDEIVFTSGGTEANNLAVLGVMAAAPPGRDRVVTSAIEHHAVLEPCAALASQGRKVTRAGVDRDGRLSLQALAKAVGPDTALVSVMLANHDTGVVQPIAEVAALATAAGALVHTDAVQAAGKIPIDVKTLGVALLTFSAHKLSGPKGAGAVYLRRGVAIRPLAHGGRQERALRPGTENVPAIVGFGKACALAEARLDAEARRLQALRDQFEAEIVARLPATRVQGRGAIDRRLPNTSNLAFLGLDAEAITVNLDLLGMAASRGAACSAGDPAPSHVLLAMGRTVAEARSSVRFSFGRETTAADIERAVGLVVATVERLHGAR